MGIDMRRITTHQLQSQAEISPIRSATVEAAILTRAVAAKRRRHRPGTSPLSININLLNSISKNL